MKYKIGGGGKLQPYDEDDGQYTDEERKRQGEEELATLFHVGIYLPTNNTNKSISFPSKKKHSLDYYKAFVAYIGQYKLYGNQSIADGKISNYLFKKFDSDDKSKFMMEILKYPNNREGWNKVEKEILEGTNFHTMRYEKKYTSNYPTVAVDTIIHSADGKIYHVKTVWELHANLTKDFLPLYTMRIGEMS